MVRMKATSIFVLTAAIASGVFTGSNLLGQSASPAAGEFEQDVLPVLSRSCIRCHNDRLQTGKLSLEGFRDGTAARQRADVWQKVLDKITTGQMPPRPAAPLPSGDVAAVSAWIRTVPGITEIAADASASDPGRVTARRLNRVEYNNTIRDLLGVTIRPADEFPIDDSGYGFDNIGDVLSLSPMLMEKYVNAARVVARAAVFGEALPGKTGTADRAHAQEDAGRPAGEGQRNAVLDARHAVRDLSLPGRRRVRVQVAIRQLPRSRKARRAGAAVRERGRCSSRPAAVGRCRAAGTRAGPWPGTRSGRGRPPPAANRRRAKSARGETAPGVSADADELQHRRYARWRATTSKATATTTTRTVTTSRA